MVIVEDLAYAVPLARALVAGGLPAIEATLRTQVALVADASLRGLQQLDMESRSRTSGRIGRGSVKNRAAVCRS